MKKLSKRVATLSLVGCAVMVSPFAVADDSGWYIGANVGQSRAKIDDARITAQLLGGGFTTTSIVDANRDTGYKIFGGYQFNENLALEGGYFDLGKFGFTSITAPAGTLNGNIRLKGLNLDAVGTLPITEKLSVLGRIGLNYAQAKDSFSNTGLVPVPANPSPSKSETNYKYGLGIQYSFTHALGMRVEAERYRVNDAVGNKGDIDLISIGLVYRFGKAEQAPAPVAKEVVPAPVAPAPKPVVATPPAPRPMPKKLVFSADSSTSPLFSFGKANTTSADKRALDQFAEELRGADYDVITVTGHTDRIGSNAYNMKLSERRADVVRNYLVESAGIPADKITRKGVGETEPVTKPGECRGKLGKTLIACLAPDRRVEVEVAATRVQK